MSQNKNSFLSPYIHKLQKTFHLMKDSIPFFITRGLIKNAISKIDSMDYYIKLTLNRKSNARFKKQYPDQKHQT